MNCFIIKKEDLLNNEQLLFKVYEIYKYISRCNMTKEEFWTINGDETIDDIKKVFDEGYISFISKLNDFENDFYYVIIQDNEQIIGELSLSNEENSSFSLGDLVVDFNYRRRGIATRLIEESIKFICNNYHNYSIVSYIDYDNKPSINLHKKIGFKLVGKEKKMGKYGCYVYEYKKRKC